jgi:hypothetical protein
MGATVTRVKHGGATWKMRLGRVWRVVTRQRRGATLTIRLTVLPDATPEDMIKVLRLQVDLLERAVANGATFDQDETFFWRRT